MSNDKFLIDDLRYIYIYENHCQFSRCPWSIFFHRLYGKMTTGIYHYVTLSVRNIVSFEET